MNESLRHDGRRPDEKRPVSIEIGTMKFAEGSALIQVGDTRVLASASVEKRVPRFLERSEQGWLTAEYAMLPRATQERSRREVSRGRVSGRTAEIQRLIGRSLRAVVDLRAMPGFTLTIDCDVLQADGGTRTASITAGYVAAAQALGRSLLAGDITRWPMTDTLAAISMGIVNNRPCLDLDYVEDSSAAVDMNLVATGSGKLVELQGTGEERSFERQELDALLDLGMQGISELIAEQDAALAEVLADVRTLQEKGERRPAPPRDEASLWGEPEEKGERKV
jgi:ribonuclease PH